MPLVAGQQGVPLLAQACLAVCWKMAATDSTLLQAQQWLVALAASVALAGWAQVWA
jgi:hypothetical protein